MLCHYPTAVNIIDDDKNFLQAINYCLNIPNSHFFTSPLSLLNELETQPSLKRIHSKVLPTNLPELDEFNVDSEHYPYFINLKGFHEEIYNPDRFKDISVLVVDYQMGDINGIEVCDRLMHHPAKKILLTGSVDKEKLVIEAFNNGVIHHFINKGDVNFSEKLQETIHKLQDEYFRELNQSALLHLSNNNNLLGNEAYTHFITEIKTQINAVEYYLLNISGSMLFLDEHGTPTWLNIKSNKEICEYESILKDLDGDKEIIAQLSHRKKIPFLFTEEDHQEPIDKWENFCYAAKPLPDQTNYYYSLISGHIRKNLTSNKITSYRSYIDSLPKLFF